MKPDYATGLIGFECVLQLALIALGLGLVIRYRDDVLGGWETGVGVLLFALVVGIS